MRTWLAERGGDLRGLSREERARRILELGTELIGAVGQVIPALPVPLVATVLLDSEDPLPSLEVHRRTQSLARRIQAAGGHVYVPRTDEEYATAVGLRALTLRRLVEEREGGFAPVPGGDPRAPVLRQLHPAPPAGGDVTWRYRAAGAPLQPDTSAPGGAVRTHHSAMRGRNRSV